jgi:hypothetical protein
MADITVTAAKVGLAHPEDSEVYTMIAGVTITKGQAVYIIAASGKLGVADANAAGAQQIRGIALDGGGAGQAIDICKRGWLEGFTLSGNYDSAVYLSDTAGALADAAGTMTVNVGRVMPLSDATPTKLLYVDIDWLRTWS